MAMDFVLQSLMMLYIIYIIHNIMYKNYRVRMLVHALTSKAKVTVIIPSLSLICFGQLSKYGHVCLIFFILKILQIVAIIFGVKIFRGHES